MQFIKKRKYKDNMILLRGFLYLLITGLSIGIPLGVAEEQCLDRFMDMSLVQFRASKIGQDTPEGITSMDEEIRIMTNVQFSCVTQIYSVLLGIDIRYMMNNRDKYPSVQLWRSADDGTGNIQLVSERMIVYTPANVSNTGVYQYPLTPPLNARAGDYLAISQPKQSESIVRVYTVDVQSDSSYEIAFGGTLNNFNGEMNRKKLVLLHPITAQSNCVTSTASASFVSAQSLQIAMSNKVKDRRQFIYPDMKFMCNGRINKWIYAGISGPSTEEIPELQVWRLATGFTDTYIKIGSSPVIINETGMNSNIHELSVDPPIEFMEGDVFGLHQPREDRNFKLQSQRNSGPRNIRYNHNVDNGPLYILDFSTLVEEDNDYPLVTMEISQEHMQTSSIGDIRSSPTRLLSTSANGRQVAITSNGVPNVLSSQIISTVTSTVVRSFNIMSRISSTTINNNTFADNGGLSVVSWALAAVMFVVVIMCMVIVMVVVIMWKRKVEAIKENSTRSGEEASSNTGLTHDYATPRYSHLTHEIIATAGDRLTPILPPSSTNNTEPNVNNGIYSEVDEDQRFQPNIIQNQTYEWNIVVPTLDERKRINASFKNFKDAVSTEYSLLVESEYDQPYQFLNSTVPLKNFFEESNIYWAPGSDYGSLYEQLSLRKFREILSSHVSMSTLLGSGQFGVVMKGTWTSPDGVTPVAIKTVKQNAVEEEKVKFLQEAAIMGQFHHPNIIRIQGVVTMTEPTMIVLELMHDGDLHSYLKQLKPSPGEMVDDSIPELLLSFCRQVASAMDYLASKSFIHRDIAARNVLVTDKKICKISDFGMSRDLQEENYYISKGGQIPIKWTAPEALSYKKYSTASDVWSYGVLMYEIWSLGSKPFQSFTNQQTFRKVCDGYRLPPPPGCPRPLYEMMIKCWNPEYALRPSFCSLVADLSDHKLLEVCPPSNGNSQACVLGAPIEAGLELYPDLQSLYINN